MLIGDKGQEVGKGSILFANGKCFGRNLEELRLCVVDVKVLTVAKWSELPHPSDATCTSFAQAEMILG